MVSRKTLDLVAEAFARVHRQGKVRWLGISAHNPKVFRRVLNDYPQFSAIIFPYLFLTQPFGAKDQQALRECRACHKTHDVRPEKLIARWLKRVRQPEANRTAAAKPKRPPVVCTDCHGQHKVRLTHVGQSLRD